MPFIPMHCEWAASVVARSFVANGCKGPGALPGMTASVAAATPPAACPRPPVPAPSQSSEARERIANLEPTIELIGPPVQYIYQGESYTVCPFGGDSFTPCDLGALAMDVVSGRTGS